MLKIVSQQPMWLLAFLAVYISENQQPSMALFLLKQKTKAPWFWSLSIPSSPDTYFSYIKQLQLGLIKGCRFSALFLTTFSGSRWQDSQTPRWTVHANPRVPCAGVESICLSGSSSGPWVPPWASLTCSCPSADEAQRGDGPSSHPWCHFSVHKEGEERS